MKSFFLTAQLGSLKMGMHATDVHALLGSPEDVGVRPFKGWTIEAYANCHLQLFYEEGIIGVIAVYFKSKNNPPALSEILDCAVPFSGSTTLQEFKMYLKDHDIPYKVDTRMPIDPSIIRLIIGIGIAAVFDDDLLQDIMVSESSLGFKK